MTRSLDGDKSRRIPQSVDVVLEMVGARRSTPHLLAPFGRLATFGMAARQSPRQVDAGALMSRSRAGVGFWLAHCFARPELLQPQLAELLAMVADGTLAPQVGGRYPLAEAATAHADLRARRTTGKLVLECRS